MAERVGEAGGRVRRATRVIGGLVRRVGWRRGPLRCGVSARGACGGGKRWARATVGSAQSRRPAGVGVGVRKAARGIRRPVGAVRGVVGASDGRVMGTRSSSRVLGGLSVAVVVVWWSGVWRRDAVSALARYIIEGMAWR